MRDFRTTLIVLSALTSMSFFLLTAHHGGCHIDPIPHVTPTPSPTPVPAPCIVTGCSGQICADAPVATTCEFLCEYGCFQHATCERQSNGQCGWTGNTAYDQCLDDCSCGATVDPSDPYYGRFEGIGFMNACNSDRDCMVGGCSGEVCAAEPVFTTCEVLPTQPTGSCGCVNNVCVWNDCGSAGSPN